MDGHESEDPKQSTPDMIAFFDDVVEVEDVRENNGQWRWEEDKLLISAWLNVSTNPGVGTNQKSDAFWSRIHKYCEESNPSFIKRGPMAMKKRWHRINQAAQKFDGCYDYAFRKIGSSSNIESIMKLAHQLFLAKYKKKCNFEKHWNELRREQKWRTPTAHGGSSKRTKISASGAYLSSSDPGTPVTEDVVVESPVYPKCTKAIKGKVKEKAKLFDIEDVIKEELEAIESSTTKKLSLIEELKIVKQREIDMREMELEMQLLTADTSSMNELQRHVHTKMLEKIKAKYN